MQAGKIAASHQLGWKKIAAKPLPNVRLKAALPRNVNEKLAITVQNSYDHAVKLQCCTKIGKSEKVILIWALWAIDFYVELYVVYTKNWHMLKCDAELIDFDELIILNLINSIVESKEYKCQCFCSVKDW